MVYTTDAYYGSRKAKGLGLDVKLPAHKTGLAGHLPVNEVERLAAITQEERAKATAQKC